MIKRILINLVCFAYNWYLITKVRAKNRVVVARIKYVEQRKRYYK